MKKFLTYTVLIFITLVSLYPFYTMTVMGTYRAEDLFKQIPWLPGNYFFTNLKTVLEADFYQKPLQHVPDRLRRPTGRSDPVHCANRNLIYLLFLNFHKRSCAGRPNQRAKFDLLIPKRYANICKRNDFMDIIRLFIVDDEPMSIQYFKSFFTNHERYLVVGEACDGKRAYEKIKVLKPDLIFADISMPVMDGLTLAEKLLSEDEMTKIILLTSYRDFDYAKRGLRMGVTS